ncbi:hypothetical protein TcasGA2_TC012040 [Tribolium castaneum]|uniref:Uncharacterized protein n=1 Tax=Tribolium castaneum TaxID=7070 RepID=D6X298_TRICA|nr:PREDICTED: uncharacterized protein LOC100141972 [Tribolium castaneum]EFA09891.1 hypothetical protein TcasGA2_TC012040 [Tribolium castaneum]|eukprot:XP_001811012.1 PREDICTED: uncharacterized protein LOC100141972 [Tribolium castaneum]
MYRNLLIPALIFTIYVNTVNCIVCTPGICASVQCKEVQGCKGQNQEVQPGGFCSCCNVCYTILGENEACNDIVLQGVPPATTRCANGLVCYEGKCTSFKNLQGK